MASSWDDLGVDWEDLPDGIHLYSGLLPVMEAINERFRVAKGDPNDEYFVIEDFKGRLASGNFGNNSIAIKIRDGLKELRQYFIPPDADSYPNYPDPDTFNYFDHLGIPLTFATGVTSFKEWYGQSITEIFEPYMNPDTDEEYLPYRGLIQEAYRVLKDYRILRFESTEAIQYTKTVPVLTGSEGNAANANAVYAAAPVVTEVQADGAVLAPGFGYYTGGAGLPCGTPGYYTCFGVRSSGGVNGSWLREQPNASSSGKFYFDLVTEDGDPITPPLVHEPVLCWGGSDGTYTSNGTFSDHNVRGFGGGPTPNVNSSCSRCDFRYNFTTFPQPLYQYEVVTPTVEANRYTMNIFCDPAGPGGLPAAAQFGQGSERASRFGLLRLDSWDPNSNSGTGSVNRFSMWRRFNSTSRFDSPKRIKSVIAVDINAPEYLKYNTAS